MQEDSFEGSWMNLDKDLLLLREDYQFKRADKNIRGWVNEVNQLLAAFIIETKKL